MKRFLPMFGLMLFLTVVGFSQPRPVDKPAVPVTLSKPAPVSFEAKYEGGMFGYHEKETGSLKFDDENSRLVFFGKDQKEKFSIPYAAMLIVSPQSRSVTSNTGNVVRHIPLPGAVLGGLIREKRRYLVMQFDDPDVDARGVVNFKLSNKELLDSVIDAIGAKAKLTQRGEAYYRPRPVKGEI